MPDHQTYDESKLLSLLAADDHAAFKIVYNRYKQQVYSTSFKILHSPNAAQDALQEIFIKVWVNRQKLKGMDHFPAWLNTIARNHLYNKFRQQMQETRYLSYLLPDEHEDAGEKSWNSIELKELVEMIKASMDQLSPQQRKVIELSRLQGLKHREIAAEMNISQETVKKYVMEGMRQLRELLLQQGKDIPLLILLQLLFR